MSLRPAVRREGPLDQALLTLVVILLGATFVMWLTGQVAGYVNSGTWPEVSLPEMGGVMTSVPRHPLDPAAAWPADARKLLPGPVLFWATFLVLLAVLATAWVFLSSLLRSGRRRMGRAMVVERAAPAGDQVGPTGWARPQLFKELYVRGPTPWRVTLGRVNGRLVAAEPLQSVIALGPTQSQKTSGLTIPAVLEWDGPVLAACVKPDLIRSTIGRRYAKGDVFLYDPAGATGMEANTWSPLPRCETWEGAYRMALSLVNASRMASRSDREMEAIPGAATNLLASMLLAAAISDRSMSDVLRWGQRQDRGEITAAINVANEPAAMDAFESIWSLAEQRRSQVYAQVLGVIAAYTDPTVKEASAGTRFTAERLLDGVANTAYVSLPAHEQRRLGPLTVALVQDVIELAFERSRNRGAPIDPALLVVLDDAASSAALPQLDMYAASAGGYGVQMVSTFRHLSQMRARYDDRAEAVFANHRAKVILSGVTDAETLALLSHLLGDETIRHLATPAALAKAAKDRGDADAARAARSRGGASPADALGWISPGNGVLIYGHLPPAAITLRPWFRDRQLQAMVNPADAGTSRRRPSAEPGELEGPVGQLHDHLGEAAPAVVAGAVGAGGVAGDHALQDDGELPGGEGHVEVEPGQVATRAGRVGLGDGGAAGEAGHDRRGRAQGEGLVAGLGPVHQQQADVGQRVAEGAQLPVEHGQDPAGGGQDDVVEAEVAVDDPGRADLGGEVGLQAAVHLVEGGQGAGPGLVELALPAGELAFQVAMVAAELAEADLVGVDPVEGDQGVHQRVGRPGPGRLVQAGGHGGLVAGDDAVHVGHHVEGGAGDGRVLAEAEGGRHRHRGAGQGGDDPVLAAHVVGRGQHPVQGRAAQHPARPGRVGDPVGEVGTAPGDLADGQRRPHPADVGLEPGRDPGRVDPRGHPRSAGGLGLSPPDPPEPCRTDPDAAAWRTASATAGATPRSNTLGTM